MRLPLILFLTCIISCLYGQGPTGFTCTAEQAVFEVDYPIKITYTLSFEDEMPSKEEKDLLDDLQIPEEILTRKIGEESSESFSYKDGKSKGTVIRTFFIKIQDLGSFTIPAVRIDYKDKKLSTEALALNIVAKNSRLSDLTKAELNAKVFVRAEFENGKETCVLGERIIINTVIYTQIAIEGTVINEYLGGTNPSVLLDYLHQRTKPEEVELDGKPYYKQILRSYAYYPLIVEETVLSPMEIVIKRVANTAKSALDTTNILTDTLYSNSLLLKSASIAEKGVNYLAKDATGVNWSLNDSLIDKGTLFLDVDLIGTGAPFLYHPPPLNLGDRASVEILYLGQAYLDIRKVKRSFRYVIHCHEAGDFNIQLNWVTWNTKMNKKEVLSKSIETIRIDKVQARRNKLVNINPIEQVKKSKRDVVLVIDCSASMLAKDFDSTRIQAVKGLLRNLIHQKLNDERFSIVLVAGESFILCPLTFSSSKLLNSVNQIKTEYLMEGTDLTAGLMQGILSLSESKINPKDIVIFTDGASNLSYLDRKLVLMAAQEQKIRLNTVGIGIDGEFLTPVYQKPDGSFRYGKQLLELEDEDLKKIADHGGGIYTRINRSEQFKLGLNSFLGKRDLLLIDKEELIALKLVKLLLQDASYRHQKIKKDYVNIKDK